MGTKASGSPEKSERDMVQDPSPTIDGSPADRQPLEIPPAVRLPTDRSRSPSKGSPLQSQQIVNLQQPLWDREKQSPSPRSNHSHQRYSSPFAHAGTDVQYASDAGDEDEEEFEPKRHAVWILIYLAILAPFFALPIALYTLLIAVILLLLSPLCLCCANKWPLSIGLYNFLAPSPRLELYLIFSNEEIASEPQDASSMFKLIFANIFAPLYAIFIVVAAWVAAIFWIHSAVLGNPGGKEDSDDGKEAVLAVRRLWERWLMQGMKPSRALSR